MIKDRSDAGVTIEDGQTRARVDRRRRERRAFGARPDVNRLLHHTPRELRALLDGGDAELSALVRAEQARRLSPAPCVAITCPRCGHMERFALRRVVA